MYLIAGPCQIEDRDMMISVRNCVEPEAEDSDSSNNIKILHPGGN